MTELAPVLTGCHVCRSPLVDLINKRIAQGMSDVAVSNWLNDEGSYISRITIGKHKREHMTSDHESARMEAAKVLKKQKGTIKFNGDLASLVRDQVITLVDSGQLTPSLAEGLRAQEIIDRRQEKNSDRELTLALAGILGGSPILDGTSENLPLESEVEGTSFLSVQGQDLVLDDGERLRRVASEHEDSGQSGQEAQDSSHFVHAAPSLDQQELRSGGSR
jgi:hypothetical protein